MPLEKTRKDLLLARTILTLAKDQLKKNESHAELWSELEAAVKEGTNNPVLALFRCGITGICHSGTVRASHPGWHEGGSLGFWGPGSFVIKPNPNGDSRWTVNNTGGYHDFHGIGATMHGPDIGIPKDRIQIGGLVALVWHHRADGSAVPEIFDFPNGTDSARFALDEHGGSIHFMMADLPNTYGDNAGTCYVEVWGR